MLERDSFSKRYKAGEPIALHEMLYPLMQGWDSVELRCDVEIGGTDQLFNLHMGRELQRREGQPAQVCMTTPILVGTDGSEKMSKSLGNAVGVTEDATQMFGKVMSLPDDPMREWYTLVTDVETARIEELLAGHPRTAKVELARAVTASFHGEEAAAAAVAEFDRMFRQGGRPDDIPEVTIGAEALQDGAILVGAALAAAGLCNTNSEGRRLIQGGGVKVDDEKVTDPKAALTPGRYLLQAGKRKFAQVIIAGA
jgi:tyrosyl-tRNA synthetase